MANVFSQINRYLTSLRNFGADNGHTFYFASPGYTTSKACTGGTAYTITAPVDANGFYYRAVAFSAGGALYYVNPFATATGAAGSAGVSDIECPAQLSLQNADTQTLGTVSAGAQITTFSLLMPVTGTVFMRWYN